MDWTYVCMVPWIHALCWYIHIQDVKVHAPKSILQPFLSLSKYTCIRHDCIFKLSQTCRRCGLPKKSVNIGDQFIYVNLIVVRGLICGVPTEWVYSTGYIKKSRNSERGDEREKVSKFVRRQGKRQKAQHHCIVATSVAVGGSLYSPSMDFYTQVTPV